jgi:apolipoprotein N-acyltransferase
LAPLLVAVFRKPLLHATGLGFLAGMVYFGGTLYWITRVMVVFGDVPRIAAVLINVALDAYLALFVVIFSIVMARLTATTGPRALLVAPIVWVATELGRTYLLTGFPWVLLGYSQVSVLPIAQLASVFGVFGLSALVASVSAALAFVAVAGGSLAGTTTRRAGFGRTVFTPLAVTLAFVAMTAIWGSLRIRNAELLTSGEAIRVGLLQGNVEESEKWQGQKAAAVFRRYLDMSRQAVDRGARFVLWPESATPYPYGEDIGATEQMRNLARTLKVPILIGTDQIVRGQDTQYYNAAVLITSKGSAGGVYRKMHLVPFGEYVPARHVFFFMSRIVQAVSDFSAGDSADVLPVDGHTVSTAICYEIIYPNLVRQFTLAGSELLTTITNDSWFGPTSAPYQHFAQASMRAIENGRFLVRAANTGISGIVDPYGHVMTSTGLYQSAVVVGDARFLNGTTIYARTGDVFAYACTALTALLLVVAIRSGRIKAIRNSEF